MAIAKGNKTAEGVSIKRFKGVGSIKVLAVNPDEKKAEELLGYKATIAPYVSKVDMNGTTVDSVRIDFIIKASAEDNNGAELVTKLTYFIRKAYRKGSNSGKYQIIDKYGRTAWGTEEEIKGKKIPQYSNGPANISEGYRLAFIGEEEVTEFLRMLLNIPNVQKWDNNAKKFVGLIDHPEDAVCRLETEKFFKGDFSEITECLSYQPENKVKVAFGVRTDNNTNRTYQAVYERMVVSNRTTDFAKLENAIKERKSSGALADTEFFDNDKLMAIHEVVVTPTNFNTTNSSTPVNDDPFASVPSVSDAPVSDLPWDN